MFARKNKKLSNKLFEYFEKNIKDYFILIIIFVIGVILGIIFINNIEKTKLEEIKNYIDNFVNAYKEGNLQTDNFQLLKISVRNNLAINFVIWFLGSTIIGMFFTYIVIIACGFSLGFTISSLIYSIGIWKGFLTSLGSLLLQNLIFIPCIISMAVSSSNLFRCIIKDRRIENIKFVLLKHTIFCIIISILLILCSFLEVFVSKNVMFWIMKTI